MVKRKTKKRRRPAGECSMCGETGEILNRIPHAASGDSRLVCPFCAQGRLIFLGAVAQEALGLNKDKRKADIMAMLWRMK